MEIKFTPEFAILIGVISIFLIFRFHYVMGGKGFEGVKYLFSILAFTGITCLIFYLIMKIFI